MAADLKQAERLLEEVQQLIAQINTAREEELVAPSQCLEVQQLHDGIRSKIAEAKDEERTLKIGIIGDVKAGKSSFVNTCIFDGQSILPTSITPTTATLTKITYSETPCTTIHFCTQEDWKRIEDGANSYDLSLDRAYKKYLDDAEKAQKEKENKQTLKESAKESLEAIKEVFTGDKQKKAVKKKEEFAKTKWGYSEIEKACRELVDMVNSCTSVDLLSLLGTTKEIDASELNDYVGATGTYTPIVNYVEMQTDNESLEGLMLVDTPGLEDPVESRGRKTKEFLETCDVVILLSRCSQFMGNSTVRMIDQLPSSGVRRIIVAGSKLDLGVLDNKKMAFEEAVKVTMRSNIGQFNSNIAALLAQHSDDTIRFRALKQVEEAEPIFTSSYFYTIAEKLKNGKPLNNDEQNVLVKLNKYQGFTDDPKVLRILSGIPKIRKRLDEIIEEKEKIISESGDDLVRTASLRLRKVLDDIIVDSKRRMNDVRNGEANDYKRKYDHLVGIIDSTRMRLRHIFEIAADECQKNQMTIESYLKIEIRNNTRLKTETKTDTHTYETRFLLRKTSHTETTTTTTLSVSGVINNINAYFASCQMLVNDQFRTLVDKETISAQVKEVVLNAYNNGNFDFSEDDILLPLESTLSKIEIPPYVIEPHRFIDRVRSKFSAGYAKNDEIYKLEALQSELLSEASDEMTAALRECTETIRKTLEIQAASFSDEIEKRISGESQSVLKQMNDRETYIEKYENFIAELVKAKEKTDKAVG